MSKNVLIVSASPRKGGNSDLLCDQFIQGALESKNQVEKIFLKIKILTIVLDVVLVMKKKQVVQTDDMGEILEKMIEADVIVLATPVYFYTMNAQMKTMIDRTCSRYTEICDKDFYFIVSAADENVADMERTIEGFRGFTSCLNGSKEKGIVYGVGAWNVGDIKGSKAMKQAYEMGKLV
ncbi:flavodoxin family protein [Clostridioides difficile]|nr:flavodoxin family protein [Clostridioides difficile]